MNQKALDRKQMKLRKTSGWGGERIGAGRKNQSGTVNHMARPKITRCTPVHITLRLKQNLPTLRTPTLLAAFKTSAVCAKEKGLHVLHFSLLSNHLHMIVEVDHNRQLANGMRSLVGRLGRIIRKSTPQKRGPVFSGRYHLNVIKNPRQMRNTLEYVLLNTAKHKKVIEHLDRYSSAYEFNRWPKLVGRRYTSLLKIQVEERTARGHSKEDCLSPPKSWLSRTGWQMAN